MSMPVDLGASSSLFQDTPFPQMPQMAQGGMFGGPSKLQSALMAAVAGFMARRNPSVANNLINGLQSAQDLKQRYALMQLQRQQDIADKETLIDYQNKNQPPGEQERMLARYLDPTTPPAEKAMLGNMLQHPVAMDVTNPDGSVTRQYVYPGTIPQQPQAPKVYNSLPPDAVPIGGPTPSASGGFL